ncbi:MAG: hypothetical protein Q7T01_04010 [bacterium]|nr:hypothetical protein [bacterium]
MKIVLTATDQAMQFMRRAGYGYQKENGGEVAFIRRVGGSDFPRYHAYVVETGNTERGTRNLQINLHVDQKAPTYGSGKAHSGEYNGSLVEQEGARLRGLVTMRPEERSTESGEQEGKKGFFGRLFS